MERIIYILLIALCCSCGARKKTVNSEREYRKDLERLESRIEQLIEVSEKKLIDLSRISKVEVKYSAPDTCQKQYVVSETRTEIKVNTTLEESTKVNIEKKDTVSLIVKEEATEQVAVEEVRESSVKDFRKLIWAICITLFTGLALFIVIKIFK